MLYMYRYLTEHPPSTARRRLSGIEVSLKIELDLLVERVIGI
jgi:hypothetical protein